MKRLEDSWKICALCRHLEMLEEGEEFPGILDTGYLVFGCRILGWKSREDYLMEPVSQDLESPPARTCPFWEPWETPS